MFSTNYLVAIKMR